MNIITINLVQVFVLFQIYLTVWWHQLVTDLRIFDFTSWQEAPEHTISHLSLWVQTVVSFNGKAQVQPDLQILSGTKFHGLQTLNCLKKGVGIIIF